MKIEFSIPGRAQQRGSKRMVTNPKTGKPMALDMNKKSKPWMESVRDNASVFWGDKDLITGPVVLTAQFFFTRPKSHFGTGRNAHTLKASAPKRHSQSPDLAKLLRSLEDGITGAIWRDDKQVCQYGVGTGRYWTTGQELTVVRIDQLE